MDPPEIVPLDSPPATRPRAPERPCSACGLLLDPLRAPSIIASDAGYRVLCGPECERAFRTGARRTRSESGRVTRGLPGAGAAVLPKAPPVPLDIPSVRQAGARPQPGVMLAYVCTGAALVLSAFSFRHWVAWLADGFSCLAVIAIVRCGEARLPREERLAGGLGALGVALTVLATRVLSARGLAVGAVSVQGAIAAALVVSRHWYALRLGRPTAELLGDAPIRPKASPASERVARPLELQTGQPLSSPPEANAGLGRAGRSAAWLAHFGPRVALGFAALAFAALPGPFHARCLAAAAVLLAAPAFIPQALVRVMQTALTLSAKRGIFIRDEASLDSLLQCKKAFLSPRGLLTVREPIVLEVKLLDPAVDVATLVGLCAALERSAEDHPLARAITRFAQTRRYSELEVRRSVYHRHKGVSGITAQGQPVVVGSRRLMMELGVSVAQIEQSSSDDDRAELLVALDDRLRALIRLHYELHEDARPALQHLVDLGVAVVVLTGDQIGAIRPLSDSLDLTQIEPELLPEERGQAVRRARADGDAVAVIGWSGEDDAALMAADAAIAIGADASAPSVYAVAIPQGHLREAAAALWLARAAHQHLLRLAAFAFAVFGLIVVSAPSGLLTPAIAAFACVPAEVYGLSAATRLLHRFALILPARG